MCVCVGEGGVTLIGVTGDNLKSLTAHVHKVTAHVLPISYWCADVKMISSRAEIAVESLTCVRVCVCVFDGLRLISDTQTSYLKSENSRVTHDELTQSLHTSLCSFKQINKFFPTQLNWLRLRDQ